MEIITLQHNLHLFGTRVTTFPIGIKEAFDSLMKKIGNHHPRAYYGLSHLDENGSIVYYAAAEEVYAGEAEKYNYERYLISQGNYLALTLHDWMKKTGSIKDLFHELMKDTRADLATSCIEWYKTDDEMICMLKMKADQT